MITKIKLTPTYYNKHKEVLFHNFNLIYYKNVKVGDKVVKEKDSRVLIIYRKNKERIYEKNLVIYSNNLI